MLDPSVNYERTPDEEDCWGVSGGGGGGRLFNANAHTKDELAAICVALNARALASNAIALA
jgi:hypothetical protein